MPVRSPRPRSPRRGVTLVEMLVTVALLVLMMTVLVQVFAAATGAVSASKVYQDLDSSLRQLDSVIRTDLSNATARFTPPLDPKNNLGYFEYAEHSFADLQGEDADDTIRFTTKAPEGQLFTGRAYTDIPAAFIPASGVTAAMLIAHASRQPIVITSQYAEVIYFLRNGNLYRRVLLVAPDRQNSIIQPYSGDLLSPSGQFTVGAFGTSNTSIASWQGVNDLSARPNANTNVTSIYTRVTLNTLGDLTNRENRYASPRFSNDFVTNSTGAFGAPDSIPDDENFDTIPDFYPSLYYNLVNPNTTYYVNTFTNNLLVNEIQNWPTAGKNPRSSVAGPSAVSSPLMAFPYIFPGAYNKPDPATATAGVGWIHTPDPSLDQTTLDDLKKLNHSPLDIGDSLPVPPAGSKPARGGTQNWWGFPTWRETLSQAWNDPYTLIQTGTVQPNGLTPPTDASVYPPVFTTSNVLPPLDGSYLTNNTPFRMIPQPYADTYSTSNALAGSSWFAAVPTPAFSSSDLLWRQSWEDDLIATGVRSFDVKAYDDSFSGYVDLGWGDDLRIVQGSTLNASTTNLSTPSSTTPNNSNFLTGTIGSFTWAGSTWQTFAQTFAHEGRIPPLVNDARPDAKWPLFSTNVGDSTASVNRLRRVWDSWSTDYSSAPSNGVNPLNGTPMGPPFTLPVYPSYPAPYPMALRGLQIQIRMVDPRNERIKVLTIRQDFSDKL